MLKVMDVKLDLIADNGIYQFIEKGMKGGVSYIAQRYSNAIDKYTKSHYENKPSEFIVYEMQIIFMEGHCHSILLLLALNG